MSDSESLQKGRAILEKLWPGQSLGGEDVFPDFLQMTQEHLFGEVWARPGLALRDRSMITLAVLMALARTEPLKLHMVGALNIGISRQELLEIIMHVAHFAGWPTAANAIGVAREVFSQRQ